MAVRPRNASAVLEATTDALLLPYAQLVLARSRIVGGMLLLATLALPRVMLAGVCAVLLAAGVALALRLAPEQIRSGALGYNALLVGLGVGALTPLSVASGGLLVCAVVLTVLLAAALHASMAVARALPVLTLPFLAAFYAALSAAGVLGVSAHGGAPLLDPWALKLALPHVARAYLQSLGSLVFLPRVDVGAVVLIAVLWHSRIAVVLSLAAFGCVAGVLASVPAAGVMDLLPSLGLNAMLVAVALGGVWFVPSASSFALALAGAMLATLVGLALTAPLARAGMAPLIVPFNATTLLVLVALRQRTQDGAPHAVDFVPGAPEDNLAYHRSRRERFGAIHGLRFALPVRGAWTCSQGVSGAITHRGAWRDALDFEVRDADGRAHAGAGSELADYHCYKLPVVAPCAGVVARVVDGVADNAVGEVNLADNWGNAVVLYHAPGVYSVMAHLAQGTVAVREGQHVHDGEVLGLCGNSGRSATPHLHMQLQATSQLGAPTLPLRLHDVVRDGADGSVLHAACVPAEGERVRRLEPDADRARALRFEYGVALRARVAGEGVERDEVLVPEIDLLGRMVLRSETTGAVLYYEQGASAFAVHDVIGDASSVLHLVRVALSRVPFDADPGLRWSDRLPRRPFLPGWARPLFDAVSPFGVKGSLEVSYTARRDGRMLVIEGRSARTRRDGRPVIETRATIAPGGSLARLWVRARGETHSIAIEPAATGAREAPEHIAARMTAAGGLAHVQR